MQEERVTPSVIRNDMSVTRKATTYNEKLVEMYEETIKAQGVTLDALINLAEALMKCERWKDAFNVYAHAYSLGTSKPDNFGSLVQVLAEKGNAILSKSCNLRLANPIACCYLCQGILIEPLTLPCGHTYCKKCVTKEVNQPVECAKCGMLCKSTELINLKPNITIACILEKFWIKELEAAKLRAEGDNYISNGDVSNAVLKYQGALKLDPKDAISCRCLSEALLRIGQVEEALEQAQIAIRLNSRCAESYLAKGDALERIGRLEDAFIADLQCLLLDTSDISAKQKLELLIYKLLFLQHNSSDFHQEDIIQDPNSLIKSPETEPNSQSNPSISALCQETPKSLEPITPRTFARIAVKRAMEKNEKGNQKPKTKETVVRWKTVPRDTSVAKKRKVTLAKDSVVPSALYSDNIKWMGGKEILENLFDRFQEESEKMKDFQDNTCTDFVKVEDFDKKDVECPLCIRLFWEPVTTPCGHMFCRVCLDRCLDHKTNCPLCKVSLTEYLAERRHATTEFVEDVIKQFLPNDCLEREKVYKEEMEELSCAGRDPEHGVPLFVCTMAYPNIPCCLHVYEPRYKLMTRQCMESGTRKFGMCAFQPNEIQKVAQYGTMLNIREILYNPDGSSRVAAIGGKRFKILQLSIRDGYNVGSLEFIYDTPIPESEINEVESLHQVVYSLVSDWFSGLSETVRSLALQYYGHLPAIEESSLHSINGPQWIWWTIAILPLKVKAQVELLGMNSLKKRLESLKGFLQFLSTLGPLAAPQ